MNIITAIGNEKINKELNKIKEYKTIGIDIQYEEAIFEILEENKNIDVIIISEKIINKNNIIININKIKKINNKIKIIIILKKENNNLKNLLLKNKIENVLINNENILQEIKKILNNKNSEKNTLINNNKNKTNNHFKKHINIIYKKTIKNKIIIDQNKIIPILGTNGVGKSIFINLISIFYKNKKILIIDLDNIENNLLTILGIKKNKNNYMEKNKINNNLDIIYFNKENINKEIILEIIKKYEIIFIDTSNKIKNENLKYFLEISSFSIILVEPNLLGIKQTKELLEIYINKWKIKKDKIKIIFNKQNIYSINNYILKQLFCDFKIIGELKQNNKYNLIINKNNKIIENKIKKEYLKIIKEIDNYDK